MLKTSRVLRSLTRRKVSHTAYAAFAKHSWDSFARMGIKPQEIFQALARKWKALAPAKRAQFEEQVGALKEQRKSLTVDGDIRPPRHEPPSLRVSGYDVFFDERYKYIRRANPFVSGKQLFEKMGSEWKRLGKKQKKQYENSAKIRNSRSIFTR
ncbi:high mobility group protein [Perkinsela sp. CCAP 1560/4]|nr:high mobility group protein [Perkinsela sp. CCAP 1560/4]|eukprot:KNH09721.1 high mobility group protein [Perkinsela sp. CCAP 1560/4]